MKKAIQKNLDESVSAELDISTARRAVGSLTGFFSMMTFFPFAAPVLMKLGYTVPASWIYKVYSFLCHQRAERSMFLFGEKIAYNMDELGEIGLKTLWDTREFVGNSEFGYKVAFCYRDLGIYLGMLLSGVLFTVKPNILKPISFWLLILLIIPMALDGTTQLVAEVLSYTRFTFGGILTPGEAFYVSNNVKRVVTGLLFGSGIGLWVYSNLAREIARK